MFQIRSAALCAETGSEPLRRVLATLKATRAGRWQGRIRKWVPASSVLARKPPLGLVSMSRSIWRLGPAMPVNCHGLGRPGVKQPGPTPRRWSPRLSSISAPLSARGAGLFHTTAASSARSNPTVFRNFAELPAPWDRRLPMCKASTALAGTLFLTAQRSAAR